jgi:hypothetical protein
MIATILVGLVLFDLAACRWGADTRSGRDDRPEWR